MLTPVLRRNTRVISFTSRKNTTHRMPSILLSLAVAVAFGGGGGGDDYDAVLRLAHRTALFHGNNRQRRTVITSRPADGICVFEMTKKSTSVHEALRCTRDMHLPARSPPTIFLEDLDV